MIVGGVNIIDSNGLDVNSYNRADWNYKDIPEDIIIGNNVWICLNSIILKGTRIGDNSIVSVGSVVKGIFPSNVVIQGNSAVVVKHILNKNEHIEQPTLCKS